MYRNVSPLAVAVPSIPTIPTNPILGVEIGPDTTGDFAMSISGLAIKRSDGRYVAKPEGEDRLVDVTAFLIPGVDPMVYRLPVTRLEPGDLIVISDDPLTLRYVISEDEEGDGELEVLDPDTGDVTEYIPVQAPIFNFFVRVVSLFDLLPGLDFANAFTGIDRNIWGASASTSAERTHMDEPRERLERPRFDRDRFNIEDFLLLTMLSGQQPQGANSNLVTLLLLSQTLGSGSSSLLPILLLSGGLQSTPAGGIPQPPGTTPSPLSNPLLLFLLLGAGRRRPWGGSEHRDEARSEEKPAH